MERMKICAVLLEDANRSYDRIYNYNVPGMFANKLATGMRVSVPFGRGKSLRTAWFLAFVNKSRYKNLKEISGIIDDVPLLGKNMFRLAKLMRDRYFCSYGAAVSAMIPSGLKIRKDRFVRLKTGVEYTFGQFMEEIEWDREKLSNMIKSGEADIIETQTRAASAKTQQAVRLAITGELAAEMLENGGYSNIKHRRAVELLLEFGSVTVSDFENYESISRGIIKTLQKKGLVEIFEKEVQRFNVEKGDIGNGEGFELNSQQSRACGIIKRAMESGEYDSFLLHGITGSGKTEVYLELAEKAISMERQVIVLVPEISLTPMMVRRFAARFPGQLAVLHSRLSMGERYDQWMMVRDGKARIALGARSCIFAPFDNLGLVIMDEEHEPSYISETTPRYSAAEVAAMRCRLEKAVMVAGSATPAVSDYRAFEARSRVIELTERAGAGELPDIRVIDMKQELMAGNYGILSRELKEEIERNITAGEQTMLFLNRRGYASYMICKDCGTINLCSNCDISMTYHKDINALVCHYCGHMEPVPVKCHACGSPAIQKHGVGTQKVEEEIKTSFPLATMLRMDSDTTGLKNSHMAILDRFVSEKTNILIGTQMIAKGHDFPEITLVGIISADTLSPGYDFNSQERIFQLITQAAGRAGRGSKRGRAVIQAYNMEAYALRFGISQDYAGFYSREMELRRMLAYPPFGSIARIVFSSASDPEARKWANASARMMQTDGVEVSKVEYAPVARINKKFRYRVVAKGTDDNLLRETVKGMYLKISSEKPAETSMSIEIQGDGMF
ncbi:MAG: primosomal protein N' [Clostridia bacterium]|nr:primosomal protein N' [Clostridia bacterium]